MEGGVGGGRGEGEGGGCTKRRYLNFENLEKMKSTKIVLFQRNSFFVAIGGTHKIDILNKLSVFFFFFFFFILTFSLQQIEPNMSKEIIYFKFASAKELQLIPNIGPFTAQAIIALRDTRDSIDQGQ